MHSYRLYCTSLYCSDPLELGYMSRIICMAQYQKTIRFHAIVHVHITTFKKFATNALPLLNLKFYVLLLYVYAFLTDKYLFINLLCDVIVYHNNSSRIIMLIYVHSTRF